MSISATGVTSPHTPPKKNPLTGPTRARQCTGSNPARQRVEAGGQSGKRMNRMSLRDFSNRTRQDRLRCGQPATSRAACRGWRCRRPCWGTNRTGTTGNHRCVHTKGMSGGGVNQNHFGSDKDLLHRRSGIRCTRPLIHRVADDTWGSCHRRW